MSFDPHYLLTYLPALLRGLLLTLEVSAVALVVALVIGLVGGTLRFLAIPILSPCIAVYVEFIRNTPLLVQIFFITFGLPAIGLRLSLFWSGVFALSIWAGAFHIESIRGGCVGVARGLREAGGALGLHRWQVMRLVVLPLALRNCLPSLLNTSISLVKNTALLQAIGLTELTFVAIDRISADFRMLEMFTVLLVTYVLLVMAMSFCAARIEAVLGRPFRA
jgi:polar amino acid transport system permease protein